MSEAQGVYLTGNHDLTIRKAIPEDSTALAEARYAFREEINTAVSERGPFIERCLRWMNENLGNARWHCWVATLDGEIVGNIWVEVVEKMPNPAGEPEENGYITNFYVKPSARGERIGSGLLSAAIGWANARGIHSLFLWPTMRSIEFYKRNGFEIGKVLENNLHEKRSGTRE
jgi:ribosomal protein S18 acetylase RimI-like enzyme